MNRVRVAVVTGGSRGIGKSAAEELLSLGYKVILLARSSKNLEQARLNLVSKFAPPQELIPDTWSVDVAEVNAVKEAAEGIIQNYSHVDLLFNAAGISIPGTFDMDAENFTRLFEVNLRAPFLFMQAFLPHMLRQGGGYVVNVASRNGKVAVAGLGGYSASKYGLIGLSEST